MNPLGRVGDFECGAVPVIFLIDEIDYDNRLVEINAFYAVARIHMSDAAGCNVQLQAGSPAAVKNPVLQKQEKSAASSRFSRFAGPSKIPHTKTHGQDFLPAETLLNPFSVPPSNKGDIGDDAEKYERNEYPLLVGVEVVHVIPIQRY